MGKFTDQDGVDGPFNKAMKKAMKEDAEHVARMKRRATACMGDVPLVKLPPVIGTVNAKTGAVRFDDGMGPLALTEERSLDELLEDQVRADEGDSRGSR